MERSSQTILILPVSIASRGIRNGGIFHISRRATCTQSGRLTTLLPLCGQPSRTTHRIVRTTFEEVLKGQTTVYRIICLQVFAEQVVNYVGADDIVPSLESSPFNFTSWSEVSQVCGDSRVWGGMHFEVSPSPSFPLPS